MIEPDSVAMAICKENDDGKPTVLLRRVGERVFILTDQFKGARISRREAEFLRSSLSRAIREIKEIEDTNDPPR